jgi:uncharacterized membrane protein
MQSDSRTYEYFWISVLLKGAISVLEIIAGIVALIIPPAAVTSITTLLTQGELSEDPNDFIATHLLQAAHSFSAPVQLFVAMYLLSRGTIKVILVIALLKNKLWAYPASLIVLGLFVLYQVYQISMSHSIFIIGITLFDFVVMYFIWKEYQIVKIRSSITLRADPIIDLS